MKNKMLVSLGLILAFAGCYPAQAQEPVKEKFVKSHLSPFGLSYAFLEGGGGFIISTIAFETGHLYGATNAYVKTNESSWYCLDYPLTYSFGDVDWLRIHPCVGLGYFSSTIGISTGGQVNTSREGSFCLKLHPKVIVQPFPYVGITAGYLYVAPNFKFKGDGIFTLGLVLSR